MLRQLELFGFKSFADRTTFDFVPGITCVVGPNGSGKSNVVDAIKWILGDQSAKSLRGKEMSDVIFNGSAGRRPDGLAEATLTFDNTSRLLNLDADEIRVGRRLYRSGESEYLLNGSVVRLKDVRDTFLGTGAGTSAYSIIEQGRVDQILQANPITRRVVFEEAAGISRYKNRRVDAERRLERVAQNLARLKDIVDEVDAQLQSTRSQASKAARYRDLSHELQALWTGLAADDYRRLSAELVEAEARLAERKNELAALQSRIEELDVAKSETESALAAVDDRLRSTQRDASAAREALAARESSIRHQTGRLRELHTEISDLRRERQQLRRRAHAVLAELAETGEKLRAFELDLETQQTALAERDALLHELLAHADRAQDALALQRGERDAALREARDRAGRLQLIAAQQSDLDTTLAAAHRQLDECAAAAQRATIERDALRDAAEAAGHALTAAEQQLDNVQAERLRLLDEQGHSEKSLTAMRDQRITWEARLHVLENLEQRQEGLGVGVQEILHRARTLPESPWSEVYGCVGDALNVPLEHAALLEVALGQRVQLIVTRDLQGLTDYLNAAGGRIQGRVGFLEFDAERTAASEDVPDLSAEAGVVGRADRLAIEPPDLPGLAAQLLADTWIVETLDVARELALRHADCRFVTLQGELLDADGVLYAGTAPSETSVVSRKSELRRLRADLRQLEAEIAEQFAELTALGKNLTSVDGDLAEQERQRQQYAEAAAAGRLQFKAANQELDRGLAAHVKAQHDLDELERRALRLSSERDELSISAAACSAAAAAVEESIAAAEESLREIQQSLAEIREDCKRQQLELAKHEERVTSLRDVQRRLEHDQAQREAQLQQASERLIAALATRRDLDLSILSAQSQVAEICGTAERVDAEIAELETTRSGLRVHRAAFHKEQDALHARRRGLSDAEHACELEQRELRHQLSSLETRIEDEYQLSLPELVAQGVSALDHTHLTGDDEAERPSDSSTGEAARHIASSPEGPDPAARRRELDEHVQRLRRKIKALGHVNTDALDSLEELESRHGRLSSQLLDLEEAKTALEEIIRRINTESRRLFVETFETIRGHFRELFRKLFGGGEADIILEDPSDVLECGIEIVARPPGKELRSISLLSGGEKTLTAISLLFAMFKSKPSPYCILDEVDAALDEANVERYATIIKDFVHMTQFVVISHRKRTMTAADLIYGVTMEQAGVSKRLTVRFEDVGEHGEIRGRDQRAA